MPDQKEIMVRYLLGDLDEGAQASLESEYFSDPHTFEKLVGVENELVDNYARGRLSAPMRRRFEEYYLAHSERKERAGFAVALAARLDDRRASEQESINASSWWSQLKALLVVHRSALTYAATLGCLILIAGGFILIMQIRRHREELAQSQNVRAEEEKRERELERLRIEPQSQAKGVAASTPAPETRPSPTEVPSPPGTHSVVLALTISGARGPGSLSPPTLVIPRDTQVVHLRLTLKDNDNDYVAYRAVLQPVGSSPILTRERLRAVPNTSGASVSLSLSPSLLSSGDYMLTLRGVTNNGEIEDVSQSLFRVVKR